MTQVSNGAAFDAPWGRIVTVVTLLATTLLLALPVFLGFTLPEDRAWLRLGAMALPLTILAGTTPFMVRGYTLEGQTLLVHRLFWSTRVELAGFQSAVADPDAMRGSIRLFGNGGLFAISGLFRNKKLGIYRAFVTDPKRCVVLRVADGTLVVSPDRPGDFVQAVSR